MVDKSQNLEELKKTSISQARNLIVDSINSECQKIAVFYMNCVEKKIHDIPREFKSSFDMIEKNLNERFMEKCRESYDIGACINHYKEANKQYI